MRINIYAEELTDETTLVETVADTGRKFYGARIFLESSDKLHNTPEDDDRSAVTFWIPSTKVGQRAIADMFISLGEGIIQKFKLDGSYR